MFHLNPNCTHQFDFDEKLTWKPAESLIYDVLMTLLCIASAFVGARWPNWLEPEFTDRKGRGSNRTSASRLPPSRLGQLDSIPALVQPSGGMAARHRKGATAERLFFQISFKRNYV
ncbi:hypothetical protein CSKR_104249 [Clonorchis sinensis]|uniref:Uncharacterized protein n=1 Tax=Clonorchis sinensis TaxID=79923 RepID=A0A419QCZ0_CLOSI|nr:hypothetical protein CSKR_104249 [Clonorchis sinensis]